MVGETRFNVIGDIVHINLTDQQSDALIEIANIGMSQAAKRLSNVLNDEVELSIPKVIIVNNEDFCRRFDVKNNEKVLNVYQSMTGNIHGKVHLIFHNDESKALAVVLVGTIDDISGVDLR